MVQRNASAHARALSAMGAAKGGKARAASLTEGQRREIARRAAQARWGQKAPLVAAAPLARDGRAAMAARRYTIIPGGTVTSPAGFLAGATYAGLKTYAKDKLDLGLLFSETPCQAAGVFTQNKVCAPAVQVTRERVARGPVRAVAINSGCANTCVGPQGLLDAKAMAALAAKKLGVKEQEVLVASTGMIGVELPMAPIRSGMEKIELARDGGGSFARAIITTDTHTKEMAVSFKLGGKACTIGAAAKGAGMIHPNMATMLCFIATDAAVAPGFLQPALKAAADRSFNQITVDGDTSTSDTVVLLANGKAGNKPIAAGAPEAALFSEALTAVCVYLAKSIARDGEGATKLIEVQVESAASWEDARLAARTIAASPLVKSAVHGADPNWGRVMAALGRSGAKVEESKVALAMNDIWMFDNGAPVPFFQEAARVSMQEPEVRIVVRLNQGKHSATAWGCDLTEDYVRFNSEYTT